MARWVMGRWMDGWVNGQTNEWAGGQVDGWGVLRLGTGRVEISLIETDDKEESLRPPPAAWHLPKLPELCRVSCFFTLALSLGTGTPRWKLHLTRSVLPLQGLQRNQAPQKSKDVVNAKMSRKWKDTDG